MIKKYRFHIGLTLLVQSASFIILFFMLYKKKKSLANTFLDAFDADGLSLTVNGEILETGHGIYDFTIEFQH